jgi:hypothetical protein
MQAKLITGKMIEEKPITDKSYGQIVLPRNVNIAAVFMTRDKPNKKPVKKPDQNVSGANRYIKIAPTMQNMPIGRKQSFLINAISQSFIFQFTYVDKYTRLQKTTRILKVF